MKYAVAPLLMLTVLGGLVPTASAGDRDATGAEAQQSKPKRLTDAQIRQILIDESIAAYPGNCPCPYSTMSNGRKCGRRSAYSKPGGESPLCYPKDVTDEMVAGYREASPDA